MQMKHRLLPLRVFIVAIIVMADTYSSAYHISVKIVCLSVWKVITSTKWKAIMKKPGTLHFQFSWEIDIYKKFMIHLGV